MNGAGWSLSCHTSHTVAMLSQPDLLWFVAVDAIEKHRIECSDSVLKMLGRT